jgi:RNA polymerase sigma factor (sigma-70 family)
VRASVAHNKWRVETTTWPALRLPRLGDEGLARLAARGNERAFAAVYDRYHQTLYRYCRSILKDDADAQDALQSTFTRALSALQRDQRSAPLRPWLFRIAHNEAISVMRRRRRDEQPFADAALPLAASAEDQAGARARLEMLLGDLASLPERARSALVMRELSGLSHEEIAVALEISPGAAKQAIFEARRGIAECAEGRVMACAEVCRAISDGDRRVLRGRRVRAHLRDCASCSAFAAAIGARQVEMRAIVPVLPAAASAVVLARAMESAIGGGTGGGALGTGGAATGGAAAASTAGKAAGVAIVSKGFATASVLATAAVTVGGIAAVVRIDSSRPPATSHSAPVAPPRPAPVHHATARASSSRAGSTTPRGTPTGAGADRHVRLVYSHAHGGAAGRHRSMAARGDSGSRAHGRADGGRGSHGGRSEAGHGHGAASGIRHDTLVGYAGEHGHGDHAGGGGRGRGDGHGGSGGHGQAGAQGAAGGEGSPRGRAVGHDK